MNDFNAQVIADFKRKGGKPGGYFKDAPVLLLYSIGARSGQERQQPLMYLQREADGPIYIFASYGGADKNPAWFHNLVAHPDVDIEIGDGATIQRIPVHARMLEEPERTAIYAEQARRFPQFAGYEEKTSREAIPVVELTRR